MQRPAGLQDASAESILSPCYAISDLSYDVQEMFLEARGSYEQAEALILEQLEEAPESQMLLKRQVALEKTKGNLSGAIEMLRKYVETFQTDREAWEELGHLYLEVRPAMMATVQFLHADVVQADSCGSQPAICCREHVCLACTFGILPAYAMRAAVHIKQRTVCFCAAQHPY